MAVMEPQALGPTGRNDPALLARLLCACRAAAPGNLTPPKFICLSPTSKTADIAKRDVAVQAHDSSNSTFGILCLQHTRTHTRKPERWRQPVHSVSLPRCSTTLSSSTTSAAPKVSQKTPRSQFLFATGALGAFTTSSCPDIAAMLAGPTRATAYCTAAAISNTALWETAEAKLREAETSPWYSQSLLQLATSTLPNQTRLAAALAFKNFIKKNYRVRRVHPRFRDSESCKKPNTDRMWRTVARQGAAAHAPRRAGELPQAGAGRPDDCLAAQHPGTARSRNHHHR